MRILVTGGLGFIGSHLCARLAQDGHHVIAFDNTTDASAITHAYGLTATYPGVYRFVPGTICDPVNVRACFINHAPDVVIHLAALAGVRASVATPSKYVNVNVEGLLHVLEASREAGVLQVLVASSSSVYGHPEWLGVASRETDHADRPLSPYAASKRAGELLCSTYGHLHGMSIMCLRFFSVYGPRQRADLALPIFAKQMLTGAPVTVYGDGLQTRDLTYVEDVVAGLVAALRVLPSLPVGMHLVNLGSGAPLPVLDMIEMLQEALGVETITVEHHPAHPADADATWADTTSATLLLGWVPSVGHGEGIQRFADWYKGSLLP